jgi:hypothetical protein
VTGALHNLAFWDDMIRHHGALADSAARCQDKWPKDHPTRKANLEREKWHRKAVKLLRQESVEVGV